MLFGFYVYEQTFPFLASQISDCWFQGFPGFSSILKHWRSTLMAFYWAMLVIGFVFSNEFLFAFA